MNSGASPTSSAGPSLFFAHGIFEAIPFCAKSRAACQETRPVVKPSGASRVPEIITPSPHARATARVHPIVPSLEEGADACAQDERIVPAARATYNLADH